MKKKVQALLKNQKGFTLVELLAVIVILGIIGAIAVPSIAGIIDNSKKDAHIANAQQMVSAARLAVAANDKALFSTGGTATATNDNTANISLEELIANGYLEDGLVDPDTGKAYTAASAYVQHSSYVEVTQTKATAAAPAKVTYKVVLKGKDRGIALKDPTTITRADVQ